MEFREWLADLTKESQGEVAERIGMGRRTLQNQIYRRVRIETVIAIAEAYNVSPVTALIDLGFLSPRWATPSQTDIKVALRSASAEDLANEVTLRLLATQSAPNTTTTDPPAPQGEPPHGIDSEIPVQEG